jgi:hypothetical protein
MSGLQMYTEVCGTTTYVTGKHGELTALHHMHGGTAGAFVKESDGGMFYVELGGRCGERGAFHEVTSVRRISRDEFDRLTDIPMFRHSMGWRS